jgi:WD40 repeat protein
MRLMELVPSPEYRTLISSLGAAQGDYYEGDISPDGRLLALGMQDGVRLWDLATNQERAFLPVDLTWNVRFQPDGRGLYTSGTSGLRRWPIQSSGTSANDLRVGPPRTLVLPFAPYRIALDHNGRKLAVVGGESETAALLLDLDHAAAGELIAHPKASYVALSSDARWIATSGWHSKLVRLWRAQDGKMIHEWNVIGAALVAFAPDARTLIISDADEFSFWDVETLKLTHRVRRDVALYPGHVAFSPDGQLMALEMAPGVIHLKDVLTTRTVAKLEDPGRDRAVWMSFSPDGTKLVVTAHYARAIHIWDLRLIRTRLKAMGMDWEWPEFPPAPQSELPRPRNPEPTLKIEVIAAGSR